MFGAVGSSNFTISIFFSLTESVIQKRPKSLFIKRKMNNLEANFQILECAVETKLAHVFKVLGEIKVRTMSVCKDRFGVK